MMTPQGLLAWHFVGSERQVRPGQVTRVAGIPVPAEWGLHASERAADALFWAPGLTLCRVQLAGKIVEGDRKFAAQKRTVLWVADATEAVWTWGIRCAQQALDREHAAGRIPDRALRQAISARRCWIENRRRGEAEILATRGPARAAMRRACGQDSGGHPTGTRGLPEHARLAARLCFHLVAPGGTPWRPLAARPAGWDASEIGRREGEALEALVGALEDV